MPPAAGIKKARKPKPPSLHARRAQFPLLQCRINYSRRQVKIELNGALQGLAAGRLMTAFDLGFKKCEDLLVLVVPATS